MWWVKLIINSLPQSEKKILKCIERILITASQSKSSMVSILLTLKRFIWGKSSPKKYLMWLSFSHQVMSSSLWPHGLQCTRLLCPSLSFGACSNSCTLSQWCHPTISSSIVPFSSCPQSFSASGSSPTSRLFTSGGQSIGALASVLPINIQG